MTRRILAVTVLLLFCMPSFTEIKAADPTNEDIKNMLIDMARSCEKKLDGGKDVAPPKNLFPMLRVDDVRILQGSGIPGKWDLDASYLTTGDYNNLKYFTLLEWGKTAELLQTKTIMVHRVIDSASVGNYRTDVGAIAGEARSVTIVAGIFTIPEMKLVGRHTFIGMPPEKVTREATIGVIATGLGDAIEQMHKWIEALRTKSAIIPVK